MRNMRNEKIRIKIRNTARFLIAMLLIMVSLFIMLPNYMKLSEDTMTSVKNEIKTSWEEKTENYLELIRTDLETSVNNNELNPYDNDELEKWLDSNMNILRMKRADEYNVSIVSMGYTKQDQISLLKNELNDSTIINNNYYEIFNTQLNNLISHISTKDNIELVDEIDNIAIEINKTTNLPISDIKKILCKCVFVKNVIIMNSSDSSNNVSISNDYIIEEFIDKSIISKTLVIPEGVLGFDEQTPYNNNGDNYKFKKIAITISTKEDVVLSPYEEYLNNFKLNNNITLILLCVIIISLLGIIIFAFVDILKFIELSGGDDAIKGD